ncbi:Uncharacterised protein [Kurthia zopfii]|nr:Uncharacterised protein [Kurthia zopfii]
MARRSRQSLYQSILIALKDKNLEQLTEILEKPLAEGISKEFKRSIKTLKYHLSSIENSFLFPYNNGRIYKCQLIHVHKRSLN